MPGPTAKNVIKVSGQPPEKGSTAWLSLIHDISKTVHNGQPICAVSGGRRTDGWPCESRRTMRNGLCRVHGGAVRSGAEHHAFKHGRSSRVYRGLPKRFRDAYMASIEDDDLLSLRADIALADARAEELVERLDSGETGDRWRQLGVVAGGLLSELAKAEPSFEQLADHGRMIEELAKAAVIEDRSWRELRDTRQHRRKLVDTERKRLKDLHAYLTAEEALAIVARLTDTIVRHVDDRAALTAILYEIQQLTGNDPREVRQRRISA